MRGILKERTELVRSCCCVQRAEADGHIYIPRPWQMMHDLLTTHTTHHCCPQVTTIKALSPSKTSSGPSSATS